jgi:prepilin-type N-terminal cleavage/methylation domain-containing protein
MDMRKRKYDQGFTLIEMIGVLAVVAVLAALIIPKVFAIIASSKIDALASACKTYEAAVTKYYVDIGSVLPLNTGGTPQAQGGGNSATARSLAARLTLSRSDALVTGTNLWPKFNGPYLEKFDSTAPPGLGTNMYMPANTAVSYGTATTGNNRGWDLKGDDGNSDLNSGSYVVYLRLTGIGEDDFLELDRIIDSDIGSNNSEKKLRGRAKWHSGFGGSLYLYLAHR